MSSSSTGSSSSSSSSTDAKLEAFLGVAPRLFLEDVYRSGEDFFCDIVDGLEKEVHRLCEEHAALRTKGRMGGRKAEGSGPTDSALRAEVASGVDSVWETLLQAHELVGDQFEAYALRNIFVWPEGLEYSVSGRSQGACAMPGGQAGGEEAASAALSSGHTLSLTIHALLLFSSLSLPL